MHLSEINIYPVKSLAGISLKESPIDSYGLRYDRKWMLIGEDNTFISQRTFPKMALLKTAIDLNHLKIFSDQLPVGELKIDLIPQAYEEQIKVNIWEDQVMSWRLSAAFDHWFSQALDIDCRLVYMPSVTKRKVNSKFAHANEIVGFADDFPFLLISEASLQDLNSRLPKPVPMKRFRANLIIANKEPYAEDLWHIIKIGDNHFEVAKPCARCSVTTVDTETALRGKEPLSTLATYRSVGNKVMFGQNLLCQQGESLKVGDQVEVISLKQT